MLRFWRWTCLVNKSLDIVAMSDIKSSSTKSLLEYEQISIEEGDFFLETTLEVNLPYAV